MISTGTTKHEHPRPEDGGLRDLNPSRRAARLRDGEVHIERVRPLQHLVHLPDGSRQRRRTFGAAERVGHEYLDRGTPTASDPTAPGAERPTQTGLRAFLKG
jgi:hypothetical protein